LVGCAGSARKDIVSDSAVIKNHAAFIWSVADLLRGDYKQSEYGTVILPLTVLRRLDCVLESTKAKVLERHAKIKGTIENIEPVLCSVSREQFYNTNPLDLPRLLDDSAHLAANLRAYIAGFSSGARDVLERFDFETQINRLDKANLLYLVVSKFAEIDLHPSTVSNLEMGYLYEELIRRFSELSNETAGEHFTPREVIRLMVNLLFAEDSDVLTKPGTVRTLFDPACGTGGMLSVAQDYLHQLNSGARLEVFGQELNDETYAICRSDMMLKGQDASHIAVGNSFSEDGHAGRTFDYMLANPPFGVEWKKVEADVKKEHEQLGFRGRFGAGLPRITDGSFLFLQHMISKIKPIEQGGSRLAIVFNGSPLLTGAAGSGESEIRRWIIENDWLEAVVALPDQLFYNTGIATYFWIVSNRKAPERQGKIQLVDARDFFVKMRQPLGEKRKQMNDDQIDEITRLFADFTEGECVKIFPNEAFGYLRITVERPARVEWRPREFSSFLTKPEAEAWMQDQKADLMKALSSISNDLRSAKKVEAAFKRAIPALSSEQVRALVNLVRVESDLVVVDSNGNPEPEPDLRDTENVPLPTRPVAWQMDLSARLQSAEYVEAIHSYMIREVIPYVSDAWVALARTKIGYEIPLTQNFYKYVPPRPLADIDAEIQQLEAEIQTLLHEVTE
jgi:type I restriction enzyme M protein